MSTIEAPAQPVVQPVTRADVLHRAADLLEEFGWCQGTEGMPMGRANDRAPYCFLGAVIAAHYDFGGDASYAYGTAAALLHNLPDTPYPDPSVIREAYEWNDDPSRTKAEVVARLRAAANTSPQ